MSESIPGPASPLEPTPPPQPSPIEQQKSWEDPTGAWQKFLSASGQQATPQEVQMFIQGLLKNFNIIIQQSNEAHKRAMDDIKKAFEGTE